MGTLSFKYNKPINLSYAPGFVTAGPEGKPGKRGDDGNAVYFIDHDLNNSYVQDLALQKIENNFRISSDSMSISIGRKYRNGDIVISPNGNTYRIRMDEEHVNIKYSIEYIGRITPKTETETFKVTGLYLCFLRNDENQDSSYGFAISGCAPSNRRFLSETSEGYFKVDPSICANAPCAEMPDAFKLYGIYVKFVVTVSDDSVIESKKATVEATVLNEKSVSMDSAECFPQDIITDPVGKPFYKFMQFGKKMEFPAEVIRESDAGSISSDGMTFISDMEMDKIVLCGNTFRNTIVKNDGVILTGSGTFGEMPVKLLPVTVNMADTILHSMDDGVINDRRDRQRAIIPSLYKANNGPNPVLPEEMNFRGGEDAYFSSLAPAKVYVALLNTFVKLSSYRVIVTDIRNDKVSIFEKLQIKKQDLA